MCRLLILAEDPIYCTTLKEELLKYRDAIHLDIETANARSAAFQLLDDAAGSEEPFDIILMYHSLSAGCDLLEMLQALKGFSCTSDLVIITSAEGLDSEILNAGASRVLHKPTGTLEIVATLKKVQDERRQSDWHKTFIRIAQKTQISHNFHEAAQIIVNDALDLGFERARLFWVADDDPWQDSQPATLVGIHQAGISPIHGFIGHRFSVDQSPYALKAMHSRNTLHNKGRSEGPGFLEKEFINDFRPSVGDWVLLPLWVDDRFMGDLAMDNVEMPRGLNDAQVIQLDLFAHQVAAILNRVLLQESEKPIREELAVLNQIGKDITEKAVSGGLEALLVAVHAQVSKLMDASNFQIVLHVPETRRLEYPLNFRAGQHVQRNAQAFENGGIVRTVIETSAPQQEADPYNGALVQAAVPLLVEGKAIGAIVLKKSNDAAAISADNVRVLNSIADQVAGALQITRLKEMEQEKADRMSVLPRANLDLLYFIETDKRKFYKLLLTMATSQFGFRFNHAMLFLLDKGRRVLTGQMGIGEIDPDIAHVSWEKDRVKKLSYDETVAALRAGRLPRTALENLVSTLSISVDENAGPLGELIRSGQRVRLTEEQAKTELPVELLEMYNPGECALIPYRQGRDVNGVVIVDNKIDGKPIDNENLDRLEIFLTSSALIMENESQRQQLQGLLKATRDIVGQSSDRPLNEVLAQVSSLALDLNGASFAIIYPVKQSGSAYSYYIEGVGSAGKANEPKLKDKPRSKGISAHVLRTGALIVRDLRKEDTVIGGVRLSKHSFIEKNGFQAFIALPIRDWISSENLGVLFVNYTTPRDFREEEIRQAESFADMAAMAIRSAYQAEEKEHETSHLRAEGLSRSRELEIMQRVLDSPLTEPQKTGVIKAIIDAVPQLLNKDPANLLTTVILREWNPVLTPPANTAGELTAEMCHYSLKDSQVNSTYASGSNPVDENNILMGKKVEIRQHGHQVFAPIALGENAIGIISVESSKGMIGEAQRSALERLANTAASAFDKVLRQEHLEKVLVSSNMVAAPVVLQETLEAIRNAAIQIASGISAMTLWSINTDSGEARLGISYGVTKERKMRRAIPPQDTASIVMKIINESDAIFAQDVRNHPLLSNHFVFEEGICSTAAFPLHTQNEKIGAMFFNYREEHHFSTEEQSLFKLFAQMVASSLRDAEHLRSARSAEARLNAASKVEDAVSTKQNIEDIMRVGLEELRQLLQHRSIQLCLLHYNEYERTLHFNQDTVKYYKITNPEFRKWQSLSLDDTAISCKVARKTLKEKTAQTEITPNVDDDPSYKKMIRDTRSELCRSMVDEAGNLLGVLVLESPDENAFEEDDVRMVEMVAQKFGQAIKRANDREILEFESWVATIGTWSYTLAHDLKGGIRVIRGNLDSIQRRTSADSEVQKCLQTVEGAVNRLTELTHWDASDKTEFDLNEFLKKTLQELNSDDNVEVMLKLEANNPLVNISPSCLKRALSHLVVNVEQVLHTADRPGVIYVSTSSAELGWVEILFEDDGPGIPENDRADLFRQPKKKDFGGAGLFLTRADIHQMGGSIRLLGQIPERGARFSIRLPLAERSKA